MPAYMYFRYCDVCAIGVYVFIRDLLPPTNGIDHNSSIAMWNCKMVLQCIGKISSILQRVAPSTHSMYCFLIQFHHVELYLVELRSTTASLLDSQPCKYISLYITCQVPCAHSCIFFLSTTCWRLTLTCGHDCLWTYYKSASETHMSSFGPYPLHQRRYYQWLGYPQWCRISLFHTRHHPQLVPPWVEVCCM